ncbi:MAG: DNA-binding transcriptional regulator [Gammaproteobacteria bacterium]|nr:MAG: DNA-binding transcriptional regulator [Gammaproteobacteria bacterium]
MKRDLFEELKAGIKAAGAHRRGKRKLKTVGVIPSNKVNVRNIRKQLQLSQASFAVLIRTSKRTVQDWEQGRRQPTGPARALLKLAEKRPGIVLQTLSNEGI